MGFVRSHWRLAWRTTAKAFRVTFYTVISMLKSKNYSNKRLDELASQRKIYNFLQTKLEQHEQVAAEE